MGIGQSRQRGAQNNVEDNPENSDAKREENNDLRLRRHLLNDEGNIRRNNNGRKS